MAFLEIWHVETGLRRDERAITWSVNECCQDPFTQFGYAAGNPRKIWRTTSCHTVLQHDLLRIQIPCIFPPVTKIHAKMTDG